MTQISLEIVNFQKAMRQLEDELLAAGNIEIKARIEFGTQQLRQVTPVDTGEARSGWYNEMDFTMRGKLLSGTIINEVEHISELNNGSSQQAPKYFIEQVLSKIGLITPI
jgi:hypothetical protein